MIMRSLILISLHALIAGSQDYIDNLSNRLVDTLLERAHQSSFLRQANVDDTVSGKAGHLALGHAGSALSRPAAVLSKPGISSRSMAPPQGVAHGQCHVNDIYSVMQGGSFTYQGRCSTRSFPGTTKLVAHAGTMEAPAAAPETKASGAYVRPNYKGVKQVTSLGPKTFPKDKIKSLFMAGADVFRINLSHGREEKGEVTETIRAVEAEVGYPIAVLADLQGPKQRCGMFKDDAKFDLKAGDKFRFDSDPTEGDATRVFLPHPEILKALTKGKTVLIDDGKIVMKVSDAGDDWVECEVQNKGTISSRKGVNTPDVVIPMSPITDKDKLDLNFILDYQPDWVALSFVQLAEDMRELRKLIADHPNPHKPKIIAKIEKPVAIDNIAEIVKESDAIMVARGDLGVEMDLEEVPLMQKLIVNECRKQGKPVIMATQMLETMMENPSPTRAECSDVATAVFDGVDAVMLSGESAAGKYPVESVEMQRKIISRTERDPNFQQWERNYAMSIQPDIAGDADSVVIAAKELAENVKAKCLVVFTTSGTTAWRIARLRTTVPILAVTPNLETARYLTLSNHVYPAILSSAWDGSRQRFSVLVDEAVSIAREKGLVENDNDKLVITGGLPFGQANIANIIRIVQASGADCWNEEVCETEV